MSAARHALVKHEEADFFFWLVRSTVEFLALLLCSTRLRMRVRLAPELESQI